MAEIQITLPTVEYGNVKVRATPEELGFKLDEPSAFGMALAVYQASFTIGWREGAQMDVSAPVAASQEAAPGDPRAAAGRLADGRPPRTVDEANEMAKQLIESELGGVTEVGSEVDYTLGEEPEAPWDKPQVAAKRKPWESGGAAPAVKPVVDEDW